MWNSFIEKREKHVYNVIDLWENEHCLFKSAATSQAERRLGKFIGRKRSMIQEVRIH